MSLTNTLTPRQRHDLNNAVLHYLSNHTDDQTIAKLQADLKLDSVEDDNNLLVRKWNTILRLQKKIVDLEHQLKAYTDSGAVAALSLFDSADLGKLNWIPSKVKRTLPHDSNITSVAIHPKLPQLVSSTHNGNVSIWNMMDLTQPIKTIQAHAKSINAIAISPEPIKFDESNTCHVLVTVSSDLFVKVWDLRTFKLIRTLSGHEHVVSSVAFAEHGDKMYTASRDKTIRLWELKSGWCLKTFVGHSDWVRSVNVINNEYVLSGSNDQSVRLSHGESGTGLGLMIGHEKVVEVVKFVPLRSNKTLDSLSKLNNVESDTPDDEKLYNKLGFKYCASGGRDDLIMLWKLPLPVLRPHNHPIPSSNPQGTLITTLRGHTSWIKDLAFHPNGKILISCSDDKLIKFWNLETGECIRTLEGAHDGFINCVDWAPSIVEEGADLNDDKIVNESMRCIFVSGGNDQKVKVWE